MPRARLSWPSAQLRHHDGCESVQAGFVRLVKPIERWTIEIQHAQKPRVRRHERKDDLCARGAVARDVIGEGADVGHAQDAALDSGRSADAATQRNTDAGWATLERTEDELIAAQQVKASPVQVGKGMKEKSGAVRHIGDLVAFGFDESAELRREFIVKLNFGSVRSVDCFQHSSQTLRAKSARQIVCFSKRSRRLGQRIVSEL